jgi:Mrp family chromosome partitioning ATPase
MPNDVPTAEGLEAKSQALRAASPQLTAGGSGAPPSTDGSWDIVQILGRALRGRYLLAVVLSMLGAGIGATTGWYSAGPLYRSDGMVRIASVLPQVIQQNDQNQPIPMLESFMEAQQGLITSRSMLEKALKDPIWDQKGIGDERPSVSTLAANLQVEVRARSENLRISYSDRAAAVASTAIASIIAAYQNVFVEDNQKLDQQRMQSLDDYRNALKNQLDLARSSATSSAQSSATSSAIPVAETPSSSEFELPSPEKVAMVDPAMGRLLARRDDINDQLKEASAEFGPNHPYVLRLSKAYEVASERVDLYVAQYVALHSAANNDASAPSVAPVQTTGAPPLSASMQQLQDEWDRVNRRIELLKIESEMPKRFEVVDDGDLPVQLPGRRIKWTVMGAGIGGGLVLGAMVLLGLHHTRYRVYADVAQDLGKRLRFIAAVPNLNKASKPRHWAEAAQSIHYLRHKLEQHGSVFMVTSADWGEGRTSVAMSLALSLSGAGAHTLVVDADLVTRGLTRALKMESRPGFFEMLRDGDAIAPMNLSNNTIAILPAGAASESDGVSISAPAVARLLARLKEQFDVVLIDAGPALWQVETCVIAREVDGVLLTICCGQEQSLWARTLEELESVATVHGALFNRVALADFDRSIHPRFHEHVDPKPHQIAEPLANFGPMVRAVAMSLTHDIEFVPVETGANLMPKKVA